MNQGCLKAVAHSLVVLGVLLGLVGVIFVLAPGRAGKGLVMLGLAALLIGFAANRLRAMARLTPQYLEELIAALAAAANGEVTLASACGQLRLDPARIAPVLEGLATRGVARVEHREGAEVYVFAGLRETKMVKKCPYCGNEYPVNTPGRTCPACGGNLGIEADG